MSNSLEDLTFDQLINLARTAAPSHELLNMLVNDPATREDTLRLIKKKNPALSIPEIDAADRLRSEHGDTQKEIQELKQQLQDREIRERIRDERSRVMREHHLTEAELMEVEKLMIDEKAPIPHYDAAAKVYAASKTPAVPSAASVAPPIFEMPDKNLWAGGIGNRSRLDRIAMGEAYRALEEVKTGKVSGT